MTERKKKEEKMEIQNFKNYKNFLILDNLFLRWAVKLSFAAKWELVPDAMAKNMENTENGSHNFIYW